MKFPLALNCTFKVDGADGSSELWEFYPLFSAHLANLVNRAAYLLPISCDTEEVLTYNTPGDAEDVANLFLGFAVIKVELDALSLAVG